MRAHADLLILYEFADRELDVACAVASLVERRHGLAARIVQHPLGQLDPEAAIGALRPRLVALPHGYRAGVYAPYLLDWPRARYFNLMWEQLFYPGVRVAKALKGRFPVQHVVHHAWGGFGVEYLTAAGVPSAHVLLNGNPVYTLYDEPYRRYFAGREALAARHGLDPRRRWVFFPENYNWAFYDDATLRAYVENGQKPEEVYGLHDYLREAFAEVMPWCARLASRGDVEVIVRPRPGTPLADFEAALRGVLPDRPARLHVTKAESVREWIMASDCIVSSHSTSLIEAAVAGKPAYMVVPSPVPPALVSSWHALTPQLTSPRALEEACRNEDRGGADSRLGEWARAEVMARGDSIANLADYFAAVIRDRVPYPPPVPRQEIPTPQDRPIRNRAELQYHRWRRRYQHLRVRMRRTPPRSSPVFEKDLVSQAEIRRRIERWAAVLQP